MVHSNGLQRADGTRKGGGRMRDPRLGTKIDKRISIRQEWTIKFINDWMRGGYQCMRDLI